LQQVDDLDPEKARPALPLIVGSSNEVISSRRATKLVCSFRGLDIRFTSSRFGSTELSVQCRFSKVRGDSGVVRKLLGKVVVDGEASDSESSGLVVSEGDYITLEGPKVYVISEVAADGTVRCVSPSFPVNEPIVLTMEEATEALLRACR
jgi:hypothetical protein